MKNINVLEGYVSKIIYENSENSYLVFEFVTDDNVDVCVGYIANLSEGEHLSLEGKFIEHKSYGLQFSITAAKKIMPQTIKGIEKYLSSGIIKWVGPKTAEKIVQKFGLETFDIIEKEPERLLEIPGISARRANDIVDTFILNAQTRNVYLFLQKFGLGLNLSNKIYEKYKEKSIETIENNPYILASEVEGIAFKTSDMIAKKIGYEEDSPERIKSAILYILSKNQAFGNSYVYFEDLEKECKNLLEIGLDINYPLSDLQIDDKIVRKKDLDKDLVYLSYIYQSERYIAKKLLELKKYQDVKKVDDIDEKIKKLSEESSIKLAKNQEKAIKAAMQNSVLLITGGPGTGKTTIIKFIIKLLESENLSFMLAAPTGRAAKKMNESTGREAKTIHRLLEVNFSSREHSFAKNEKEPLETDVLIIDELSMIDTILMSNLLKACRHGTRLILTGDKDQLPSVGAGNVIKDILASEKLEFVKLEEIFRQAEESFIVKNAHIINQGEEPLLNEKGGDFFFINSYNQNKTIDTIIDLIKVRLPKYSNCNPISDIQVISPMRKGRLGVEMLNESLQAVLNPESKYKKEKAFKKNVFREGDKVMQIKNNYDIVWKIKNMHNKTLEEGQGVFNGDEGIIKSINHEDKFLQVHFLDGRLIDYSFEMLDELEHSFAITVHKSQGSEYPIVIIPVFNYPPMLMTRNLIYTAITRAKKMIVLIGIYSSLLTMISNDKEVKRNSSLKEVICELDEII